MAPKTHEEKLFGAACLKLHLERSGQPAAAVEIYRGTLEDLGLTEEEVDAYVVEHRDAVIAALDSKQAPPTGERH